MKLQRASPSETELAPDRRSLMKSACLCLRVSTKHRGKPALATAHPESQRLLAGARSFWCDLYWSRLWTWIKSRNARRSGRGNGITCRSGLKDRDSLAVLAPALTVRLRRTHQDSASSPCPPAVVAAETAFIAANPTGCAGLPIQPDILHTKVVDDAVDHHRPILYLWLPAVRETIVEDDRPSSVLC